MNLDESQEEFPQVPDTHQPGMAELLRLDSKLIKEVNARINLYLQAAQDASEENPNPHMSEYAGPQSLNTLLEIALRRLSDKVAQGTINMSFAYDHDALSTTIKDEVKELLGAENIAFVTSGTAANLLLISSVVSAAEDPDAITFIARESEHTLTEEKNMVRKAGVRLENIKKLPDKTINDGYIDPLVLSQTLESIEGPFIFQMSIPSNEGVVPSLDELRKLIEIVKQKGGTFLVDGARIMNALVFWGVGLDEVKDLGIDGISIGTSKKGGLAEVVALYHPDAAGVLETEAKSYGHASSKNASLAYVSGIMLTTDLWKAEAESENKSAQIFAEAAREMGLEPYYAVCSNMVFMDIPMPVVESLKQHPTFGAVYSDYGVEGTVSRIVFTGFESPKTQDDMIRAFKAAMQKYHNGELAEGKNLDQPPETLETAPSDHDALADVQATLSGLIADQTNI